MIEEQDELNREQCKVLQEITSKLGVKSASNEWNDLAFKIAEASQTVQSEKKQLLVRIQELQDEVKTCRVAMEKLSRDVDETRLDGSKKLAEMESVHSAHTRTLEQNYLKLIDTMNDKIKSYEECVAMNNDRIKTSNIDNGQLQEKVLFYLLRFFLVRSIILM